MPTKDDRDERQDNDLIVLRAENQRLAAAVEMLEAEVEWCHASLIRLEDALLKLNLELGQQIGQTRWSITIVITLITAILAAIFEVRFK